MVEMNNPYAHALDGLELPDPVRSFFAFCKERESIRVRRASGEPAPWTDDRIFQQGRFLNVFREDDRGTKAILRLIEPVSDDVESLVHTVFFARWCNQDSTMDQLNHLDLNQPGKLRRRLENMERQPWCNITAYPVEPIFWNGRLYTRLEAAVDLFPKIRGALAALITESARDVVRATAAINRHFQMRNEFPIFMAVMDLAWFRPDLIDPGSPVPTGIGAAPYLDRLQEHLGLENHHQTCTAMIELQKTHWPEAKRGFEPIDIEYLSCECRKYFSYRHGTKQFVGKNRFQPGQDARLEFDVDTCGETRVQSRIHVIAGGPCSGKTTVLGELKNMGYRVEDETSERLLKQGVANGISAETLRADPVQWQQNILRLDHELFDGLPTDTLLFTDTSFIEDVVFSRHAGIHMGPHVQRWLQTLRYEKVFFLEPLDVHEVTEVRMESQSMAHRISAEVQAEYERHGYALIRVPPGSVSDRVAHVLRHLDEAGQ